MPRNLCCCPLQVKSKYYPLIIFLIFSLFFGLQFALAAGLGVGYLYVFKYLGFLETSPQALREWADSWPFKGMVNDRSFRASSSALVNNPPAAAAASSGSGMSGMLPSFLGGGNSSQTATEPRSNTSASSQGRPGAAPEEAKSAFKAFKGKGTSLGSDLPKSTQNTLSGRSSGSTRSVPARPAAQPQSTLASNQTTEVDEDSNSLEDEENMVKK